MESKASAFNFVDLTAALEEIQVQDDIDRSVQYHKAFDKWVTKINKKEYVGPMAGVRYPKEPKSLKAKVLIVLFAPSDETDVHNEEKEFGWDPFIKPTGKFVKSLQHLQRAVPEINYDKLFLIDMFPHRVWWQECILEEDDFMIANHWLNKMVQALKPTHVYIANKAYVKKLDLKFEYTVISHPGYTNRNQALVKKEYQTIVNLLK